MKQRTTDPGNIRKVLGALFSVSCSWFVHTHILRRQASALPASLAPASSTTERAAALGTGLLRFGLIDRQGAPLQLLAVEPLNHGLALLMATHR